MLEAFERRVMLKFEMLQGAFHRISNLLEARGSSATNTIEEMLPQPLETLEELEDFCSRLRSDSTFKKKIVSAVHFFADFFLVTL